MTKKTLSKRPSVGLILGIVLVISVFVGYAFANQTEISGIMGKIKKVLVADRSSSKEQGQKSDDTSRPQAEHSTKSAAKVEPDVEVVLYFPNDTAEKLTPEKRDLANSKPETIIEALAQGPKGESLGQALPMGTKVLDVSVSHGVAVVDFNHKVMEGSGGSTGEIMEVYSVVQTLTELPDIDAVKFFVEGKPIDTLYGHMDLTEPVKPDESLVDSINR